MTRPGPSRREKKRHLGTSIIFYLTAWFLLVSCQEEECPPAARPKILDASEQYKLFMTPGFYKGTYPPNQDCHWIIKSSGPEAWINLQIHYSTMEDRLFTECDDFVEIRDGPTNSSPVLLKWCGNYNPSAFDSLTDALYIRFKSDSYVQHGRGLNMSYASYHRPGCPPQWLESTVTGNCYRLVSPKPPYPKMSWVDAQKRCSYERSNLLTVASEEERAEMFNLLRKQNDTAWIGITDAQEEGNFVSVDPNAKLYPNPFRAANNDDNKDCVYLDLQNGGPTMYNADDCRAERSYICQRRKDGFTVPYPPPESIIKQSLIAAAGITWSPAYLWLIALVLVILILLICVPWARKRYKEYKNNQVTAQSETDSRNILIQTNNTSGPNQNNNGINTVHTTGPVNGQHMPPPSNLILAYDNMNFHVAPSEKKLLVESASVQQASMPGMTDASGSETGALTYRKISAGNGHIYSGNGTDQANGFVRDGMVGLTGTGKHKHVFTVAPVEKFDRPVIRALDNVSAISLDEFWHKIEVERIRKIDVQESPPAEV